ncbi:MAG: alpha/beta hydrolase, partial [Phycisphaerae bacterium]
MALAKQVTKVLGAVLLGLLLSHNVLEAAPRIIPIWPQLNIPISQRQPKINRIGVLLAPVRWPELTCYPAPANNNSGTAVVICPGGGYVSEWVPPEGVAPAKWFNRIGVNCYILRYRLPDGKLPPSGVPWPLQDVRRAVQIVRAHAIQWHINPHHVGVMGFSAGGSVASLAGVHWLPGNPNATNPLDRFSTRPNFMVL